jgi:hypothetical protein
MSRALTAPVFKSFPNFTILVRSLEVSVQTCILKRQFVTQSMNKLATYSASGITFLPLFRYCHSQIFTIDPERASILTSSHS